MEPNLITFKRFTDAALAKVLTALLDHNHIPYDVEEHSPSFNPAFISNELTKEYEVKIKSEDFTRVNELLKEQETEDINQIEKDYYLFDFTNEELIDILAKADEWSPFDYQLARKILTDRGVMVSEEELADMQEERIEALKEPEPQQTPWITLGYICAIGGGLLGIFIGWHLLSFKKTLPDGERVYSYSPNDRKNGKRILFIGVTMLTIFIIFKLSRTFTESGY